jgi:hypothetical protein
VQQAFHQFIQFAQDGVATIFRVVQLIWTWAAAQAGQLLSVPWQNWPLWKQVVFVILALGVLAALLRAAVNLITAGGRILGGFAMLIGALVTTLPSVIVAGLIALGGLWVLNNVDATAIRWPLATSQPGQTETSQ